MFGTPLKIPETPIVQVRLTNGNKQMTTWVDARKDLSRGKVIELKKTPGMWYVEEVYSDTIKSAQDMDWHRKWTNNI